MQVFGIYHRADRSAKVGIGHPAIESAAIRRTMGRYHCVQECLMSDAASLSLDALAQRCSEETEKYHLHQDNDTQFCFELLRRAFGQGGADAMIYAFRIYERRLLSWVYSHSRFPQTGEDAEFFASWAFHNCCAAIQGEKFERFPTLAQVLQYLKLCVHTAIMHFLRDQQAAATISLEALPVSGAGAHSLFGTTPALGASVEAAELWAYVCSLLPDERDRRLASCVYVQDLTPRQIIALHPNDWRTTREISVAIYRIRQALRADPEVRRWAGVLDNA
jgi:hypothetical protein